MNVHLSNQVRVKDQQYHLDQEKRRINKMMQHLDGSEIKLNNNQNKIKQMIRNDEEVDCGKDGDLIESYFNKPLDYFTAI